jgi:undecaprenyl phosphate-alpha-L-ara4FN deformylase
LALIALKVDVDTLRGTQEGVPRLLRLFDRLAIQATFLFSVGPDHTGWALRRVLRPGFLSKVARTSVLTHYGLRTLTYGVLLPAPDIGRRAATVMKGVLSAGHECGLHSWDHVRWQDNVRWRNPDWTARQMRLGFDRFREIFGAPPATHGAAGWQMNDAALSQIDAWNMAYASDSRGTGPFFPLVAGRVLKHAQLPTTLPTFDELIGREGIDQDNVARALSARTMSGADQVFTLHAELEGGLFSRPFEALLGDWRSQGHELGSLGQLYRRLDLSRLPTAAPAWGQVAGRSGQLIVAA